MARRWPAAGQFEQALDAIHRAQTPEHPDWRLLSAEGAILDQLGRSGEARDRYRKALDIQPNEPYDPLQSRHVLRAAGRPADGGNLSAHRPPQQPGADSRVRQNLALVVGLQGRFDEAEKIAGANCRRSRRRPMSPICADAGPAERLEPARARQEDKSKHRTEPAKGRPARPSFNQSAQATRQNGPQMSRALVVSCRDFAFGILRTRPLGWPRVRRCRRVRRPGCRPGRG